MGLLGDLLSLQYKLVYIRVDLFKTQDVISCIIYYPILNRKKNHLKIMTLKEKGRSEFRQRIWYPTVRSKLPMLKDSINVLMIDKVFSVLNIIDSSSLST